MDNIVIKKIYTDDDLLELEFSVKTRKVKVNEQYYVGATHLFEKLEEISIALENKEKSEYFESGEMNKKGTSISFSFEYVMIDNLGHINIELELEIKDEDDIFNKKHRCIFCVKSEYGLTCDFFEKFKKMLLLDEIKEISLIDG